MTNFMAPDELEQFFQENGCTEKFLIDNFEYIPWFIIIKYQKTITPNFISHLRGKFSDDQWSDLIRLKKLDENLIRVYRNHVNWRVVCSSINLTEGFMREMENRLDWFAIANDQKLSIDFIREFKDKLPIEILHAYGVTKLDKKAQKELLGRVYK